MSQPPKVQRTLKLDADVLAAVIQRAAELQCTPHALMLKAIRAYLNDGRRKRKQA